MCGLWDGFLFGFIFTAGFNIKVDVLCVSPRRVTSIRKPSLKLLQLASTKLKNGMVIVAL